MSTLHVIAQMLAFKHGGHIGASPDPDPGGSPDAPRAIAFIRSVASIPEEVEMQTQIAGRVRARATAGPAVVGYLGAAAFAVAAAWYGLATQGVTVASAPAVGRDVGARQGLHIYYHWMITTLPQERVYTSVGIAAFLCLAAVAALARDWLGRDRLPARSGAFLVAAGAILWIAGSAIQLGGHRAVGLMATHANPIETVNSIAFTVDAIGDALALAAFAVIGTGLLALAWTAAQDRAGNRAWVTGTVLTGLVLLVTAGSYAAGAGGLTELMLVAGGVVLLPAWLAWTGRAAVLAAASADRA
jgi:hypothetical protein